MTIAGETIAWFREHGAALSEPMGLAELVAIEAKHEFEFGPDHREMLLTAVPVGKEWMDWRTSSEEFVRSKLSWPLEGMLFDVENNDFWPQSWGLRPSPIDEALRIAEAEYRKWPTLVPLYSHRYMPAAPSESGAPVFSVYQTDVIYYGENLLSYVKTEFGGEPQTSRDAEYLPPWSLFAHGVDVP
jgi:hypothetical protein